MINKRHKKYYKLKNPDKYIGNKNKVVNYSCYENILFKNCDINHNVIKWTNDIKIPYIIEDKNLYFYPDVYCEMKNWKNEIVKCFIKIQTSKEIIPDFISYNKDIGNWKIVGDISLCEQEFELYKSNITVWKIIYDYCKNNGYKFSLVEKEYLNKFII